MAAIESFRDLHVYQLALAEASAIFQLTRLFPREEAYSMTDQVRRSSRAVNALIAEAWGKRRYPGSFVLKLTDALGEAMETQSWLDHALACGYITPDKHRELDARWQHIGAMLNRMIARSEDFCRTASGQKE